MVYDFSYLLRTTNKWRQSYLQMIWVVIVCEQPQKRKTHDCFGVIEQALIYLLALHMNDDNPRPNLFFIPEYY